MLAEFICAQTNLVNNKLSSIKKYIVFMILTLSHKKTTTKTKNSTHQKRNKIK